MNTSTSQSSRRIPKRAQSCRCSLSPSGTSTFVFGRRLDVRPILSTDFNDGQDLTERVVVAYVTKYATKGAETATGTLDRPIRFLAELAQARITDHT